MALQWPCYNGKCRISEEREYRDWDIWADFMEKMVLSGEDSNKQRMKDTADTPWANTYVCDDDDDAERDDKVWNVLASWEEVGHKA